MPEGSEEGTDMDAEITPEDAAKKGTASMQSHLLCIN